jgi:HK97 family phage major capsid protein
VVVTPAIAQGTALVGAFQLSAQVYRREGIRVEATNSNEDDFLKNLIAIRVEERLGLAVYRPAGFGTVTGL